MKLEIKHLAPYIPYGLKVQGTNIYTIDPLEMAYGYQNNTKYISFKAAFEYELKPILRPLSDLTSLGRDDIPINEHTIDMLIGEDGGYGNVTIEEYKGKLSIEIQTEDYSNNESVDFKTLWIIMEELFKGHYDIFNLIPEGLAIDINTIEK